ncbi:MAG: 16S rRNA (guanine(966)-N(2))-methyltransferase RsmD [Bacteroidetes bacterium]|nr:16S rRNA (guanine(966)-N(2))-methyltransferase RsmD [Bacteroidota bacterium]
MRIIRGFLKGKRFSTPPNFPSRPTTDFAKEGLFNVLENQLDFEEKKVLDLCAGTGNISFEFISRGVASLLAVDSNPRCIQFLRSNIKQLGIDAQMNCYKSDCIVYCKNAPEKFDIIFSDPPFHLKFHEQLVQQIFDKQLLNENGILIIEHGKQTKLENLKGFKFCRNFGNVYFSFFEQILEAND